MIDCVALILICMIICTLIICICVSRTCTSKMNSLRGIPFYISYDYGDDVEHYDYSNLGNPTTYTIDTDDFTLKAPTKTGYTFIGWTGSNGNTPQTTVTIVKGSTGDRNYVAHWEVTSYSITYNLINGGIADNPTTYTVDEPLTLTNPTKTGYTFTGWTGSNGSIPQTTVTITGTGDKSYTANWSIINYKIDYA